MNRSEQINELFSALAKARAKFKVVKKKSDNPFFKSKYADLAEVIDCTAEALAENGLSVIQMPGEISEHHIEVETMLGHSSGQFVSSTIKFPIGKMDAQGVGTAISYARRYAYSPVLNIAAEIDDDGNQAADKIKKAEQKFDDARISDKNIKEFWKEARKSGHSNEAVAAYLAELGHAQTEQIRQSEYENAMAFARKPAVKAPGTGEELTGLLQESLAMVEARQAATAPVNAKERAVEAVKRAVQTNLDDAAPVLKPATDPFWKQFWVLAKRHNVPESDVHTYAKEKFGMRESLKELDQVQLGKLVTWVTSVEA